MAIQLTKYLAYQRNDRLFYASLIVSLATFVMYMFYFDILVPFIPQGSVRYNSGDFFGIPVFLLISAQTLFTTYFLHITIKAIDQRGRDLLKSYFISSVEILLFSFFYAFFPNYGPYTFIVYFMPGEKFASYAYPLLILWTLVIIVVTSLLIEKMFGLVDKRFLGHKRLLILSATMLAVIIAMAS